jgi:hypothetical protein
MADRSPDLLRIAAHDTGTPVDILGVAAATPDVAHDVRGSRSPGGTAGIAPADLEYSSRSADLSRIHFENVVATITRRRSLTDSLQNAFGAYWDTVVAHRDEHRALRGIEARPDTDDAGSSRFSAMSRVSTWLDLIADAHRIRWELPSEQLTLLVTATLDGLTTDYLASGDPEPARDVLRVVAYQIAQYGRRPAKNQQH